MLPRTVTTATARWKRSSTAKGSDSAAGRGPSARRRCQAARSDSDRHKRIDIFRVGQADVQGADRLRGAGLGWIRRERLQVGQVHPRLDALGGETHRVRGRLVDADDAKARRARAGGVDRERHDVAFAQRRLLGELTRDEDLREIDGRRRRDKGKGGRDHERSGERADADATATEHSFDYWINDGRQQPEATTSTRGDSRD